LDFPFIFQFTSIKGVTKQKKQKTKKMIMVIIKLIIKNIHSLTHTETTHSGVAKFSSHLESHLSTGRYGLQGTLPTIPFSRTCLPGWGVYV
jgi:hypothetical protein